MKTTKISIDKVFLKLSEGKTVRLIYYSNNPDLRTTVEYKIVKKITKSRSELSSGEWESWRDTAFIFPNPEWDDVSYFLIEK